MINGGFAEFCSLMVWYDCIEGTLDYSNIFLLAVWVCAYSSAGRVVVYNVVWSMYEYSWMYVFWNMFVHCMYNLWNAFVLY